MDSEEFIRKYSWMVRPCTIYEEEYSDCSSIRARIHQYFVHGSTVDCTQWKHDTNNCEKWESKGDVQALKNIVASESKRRLDRIVSHKANDVWEKRDQPPESWNSPLPERLLERQKTSYLAALSKQQKSDEHSGDENLQLCSIS